MDDFNDTITYYDGDSQLEPKKADIGMRIGAFIIDHIIIATVLLVPFLIFAFRNTQSDPTGVFFMFPILMLAALLVYCLKDSINGASLGKRMLGLAVRNSSDASEVPSVFKLFVRNILTFVWPIEFLVLVCSAKKTKIGDQIAHTDVFRLAKKPKVSIIVVSAIFVVSIFVVSLVFGISTIFKNDSSYKTAVSYIETNPEIINLVGDVEGYGYMPSGSLNYSGRYGQASYTIKVIGSKNTTYVHVQLEKKPDKDWEIIYCDYGK